LPTPTGNVRVSTLARVQDGYILAPRCADLVLRRAALGSKRVLVEDVRVGAEGHLGEWPACLATSTTLRPSWMSSEMKEWRRFTRKR
jgi:hypothetical protein